MGDGIMPVHERYRAHETRIMRIIGVELKARDMQGMQHELEMFVPRHGLIVPLHRNLSGGYGPADLIESFPITIHTNCGDINLQGY
jgi:hypothetical protein